MDNIILKKTRQNGRTVTIGCYCNNKKILYYKMRGQSDVFHTLNGWGADYEDIKNNPDLKYIVFDDIENYVRYVAKIETWKEKSQVRNVRYNLQSILPKSDFDVITTHIAVPKYETCAFTYDQLGIKNPKAPEQK